MRQCPRCGARATSTARYCAECGTTLPAGPAQRQGPIGRPSPIRRAPARIARPIGRANQGVDRTVRLVRGIVILAIGLALGFAAGVSRQTVGTVIDDIRDITSSVRAIPPPTRPVPEPAEVPPGGRWRNVHTLSGDGSKAGPTFVLSGAPARMRYRIEGLGLISAWVLPAGTTISDVTTLPELLAAKEGRDTTRLIKPGGRYYIDVRGGGATWKIVIEEYR